MKQKFAFIIVIISALGIDFTLIQYMFFETGSFRILEALEMFKYFTLQSNLIVTIYFLMFLVSKYRDKKMFSNLFGGVVVYISITSFVFILFIERLVSPTGFGFFGSVLNHYITPVLVMTFLYKYKDDYNFSFSNIRIWIIYPVSYLLILVIIGAFTNNYLYPFFQVEDVGVLGLLISLFGIIILFTILSFSLVKIVSKK